MQRWSVWLGVYLLLFSLACDKQPAGPDPITVFSVAVNGSDLRDGAVDVPVAATVVIVFSAALDPASLATQLRISDGSNAVNGTLSYSNQSSRVSIELALDYATTYNLTIGTGPIGKNGGRLATELFRTFTTVAEGSNAVPACTSASADCLRTVALTGEGTADFSFYGSYPIFDATAEWTELTAAVIVVHGLNRNADDYFGWLMSALRAGEREDEVALIAPFFQNAGEADPGQYYWSGSGWREGQSSAGAARIGSFAVIDRLVAQLADRERFPALEKIVIVGQSSGALFTHLYAGANAVESAYPELTFTYLVGESQYFYYPDGQRIDPESDQLYTPTGCTGYDLWPIGYRVLPPYLSSVSQATFNDRFLSRSVTYLLGNGSGPDGALNTSDCYATLLGPTRYQRGENMFRYLELAYPGVHRHRQVIVEGVAHEAAKLYQSAAFRDLLGELLD